LPLWLGISVYVWFWPTKYLTEDMRLLPASDVTTTTDYTNAGHSVAPEVAAGETTDSLATSGKEPANVVYEEKRI
jgi:hypothetical protein